MTDPNHNPTDSHITLELTPETLATLCDAACEADLPLDQWIIGTLIHEAQFATLPAPEFIEAALGRIIGLSADITAAEAFLADNPPEANERN